MAIPKPELMGFIPEGWKSSDRLQDINPKLPDGYWLDPVKLEKPNSKTLLRARLCAEDQKIVDKQDVPGAVLIERLYLHCSGEPGWLSDKHPFLERMFQVIIVSAKGGLADQDILTLVKARNGATQINENLLREMRDTVRPYPMTRVDAGLFVGHARPDHLPGY